MPIWYACIHSLRSASKEVRQSTTSRKRSCNVYRIHRPLTSRPPDSHAPHSLTRPHTPSYALGLPRTPPYAPARPPHAPHTPPPHTHIHKYTRTHTHTRAHTNTTVYTHLPHRLLQRPPRPLARPRLAGAVQQYEIQVRQAAAPYTVLYSRQGPVIAVRVSPQLWRVSKGVCVRGGWTGLNLRVGTRQHATGDEQCSWLCPTPPCLCHTPLLSAANHHHRHHRHHRHHLAALHSSPSPPVPRSPSRPTCLAGHVHLVPRQAAVPHRPTHIGLIAVHLYVQYMCVCVCVCVCVRVCVAGG